MKRFDLHTHSLHSDGTLTPEDLLVLARSARVEVLALTDHDSLAGLPEIEARAAASGAPLSLVSGVEINTNYPHGQLHVLGYGIPRRNAAFEEALQGLRRKRRERIERIIEKLKAVGLPISAQDLDPQGDFPLGRPHVADILRRKGVVTSRSEAFKRFLGNGRPGYVEPLGPSPREAIRLIRDAGGFCSLAHPPTVPGWREILPELVSEGLEGLEVYYAAFSPTEHRRLEEAASALGLIATGGSDFHGPGTGRELRLGVDFPERDAGRLIERLARCA